MSTELDKDKLNNDTEHGSDEGFKPVIGELKDDDITYTAFFSVEELKAALEEASRKSEGEPAEETAASEPETDVGEEPEEEAESSEKAEAGQEMDPEELALAMLFGGYVPENNAEPGMGLDDGDFYNAPEGTGEALFRENEKIKEKIKKRKKDNAERNRRLRLRIRLILILLGTALALFILSLSSLFVVDDIQVSGNSHFTGEEIRNIAHAAPGRNIIYNLGSAEMIRYLEQNPYIKTAEITRKFPSTMVITVTERQELCCFKYDDDYLIMDDEGVLLKKTRNKPKITTVKGLVVSKIKLGQKIGTTDSSLFSRILDLAVAMRDGDMYFVNIDMSDDKIVKAYIYDNLVVKTQYKTLMANLENGRLHKVVEKLVADNIKRGTITFADDGSATFEPSI